MDKVDCAGTFGPLHPFLVRHILYGTSGLPTGKLYYTKNPSENP